MIPQCNKDVEFNSVMTSHVILQCGNSTYRTSTTNTANSTAQTTCVWGATWGWCPLLHEGMQTASSLEPKKRFSSPSHYCTYGPLLGTSICPGEGPFMPTPLFVPYLIYFFFTFLLII